MAERRPFQIRNLGNKLQRREQRILKRLKRAQQAQRKEVERYHRAEERLQNRIASVLSIEESLIQVRQQINDLHVHPAAPSTEIEIPSWAQFIPPSSTVDENPAGIAAPIDFASNARSAAAATEENTRQAAARAAEISETKKLELEIEQEAPKSMLKEAAEVAEIEAEEENVEAITAVTIAEITAERAAAAEALAQASSVHTNEARLRAERAEQALGDIRIATRKGLLTGEEAEHALQEAEREVTESQAFLADAEAVEEQALNAAMNAEAEAEVAEGMAYAAVDLADPTLEQAQEQIDYKEITGDVYQSYKSQEVAHNTSDIVQKNPHEQAQEIE